MATQPPIDDDIAIGLIPARGGSKSIPLKNLAPVAGTPLIRFVMDAGRKASSLAAVYCSTDHPEIARACGEGGVEVIERPPELGQDDTPVTAVLLQVLDALARRDGRMPGMVALLQPTSPFLLPAHVDACVSALRAHPEADSAQTITPVVHNSHAFNQRVVEDGKVRFRFLEERRAAYNKQRKPKHFTFGNVVVTRSRSLLDGQDCFGNVSVPVEIPRAYALDVDTLEDLDYATFLVAGHRIDLNA
ncbi:acylneuraminate cytidylyltransferase family protein [Ramlibacter sp.]|uniref:acylneuraminate cytidylyltransferase family protein n=1 Tax=Ramlibacter sp. TaxID=1917967 RepID=UPI002D3BE7B7|nr:acylneuraminate cytidylyltransferase family protein [Ramlibacter sp.]HYD75000.1 acylneuraminate cytidylyltransferase family protein [Ramlibacter sp.]